MATSVPAAFVRIIKETHLDDDSQLLERVKEVGGVVWSVLGQLTGTGGLTSPDEAGMVLRLKWSHDELKLVRSSVQGIAMGVFVIAVATLASVRHHW